MDEEAAALVLATLESHFRAVATLSPAQWEDHKTDGVCPACADNIDMEAVLAARELVMT